MNIIHDTYMTPGLLVVWEIRLWATCKHFRDTHLTKFWHDAKVFVPVLHGFSLTGFSFIRVTPSSLIIYPLYSIRVPCHAIYNTLSSLKVAYILFAYIRGICPSYRVSRDYLQRLSPYCILYFCNHWPAMSFISFSLETVYKKYLKRLSPYCVLFVDIGWIYILYL